MKNIKYKLLHRDVLLIIASVLFSLFLGMILAAYLVNIPDVYATGPRAAGMRVGVTTQVINLDNECRNVVKSGGLDFFVPTRTVAEWTSFRTRPPANATVSACTFCQANPEGTVVSTGAWGAWSACGGCAFASTCATSGTGTQSITRTDQVCSGGVPVNRTVTENSSCTCTRSTDGTVCSSGFVCQAGNCVSAPTGTCICQYSHDCAEAGAAINNVTGVFCFNCFRNTTGVCSTQTWFDGVNRRTCRHGVAQGFICW